MNDECTRAKAMVFAVSVHEAVNSVNPVTPSLVIMEAASRVDFKSDDIPTQVRQIVMELTENHPITKPALGNNHE